MCKKFTQKSLIHMLTFKWTDLSHISKTWYFINETTWSVFHNQSQERPYFPMCDDEYKMADVGKKEKRKWMAKKRSGCQVLYHHHKLDLNLVEINIQYELIIKWNIPYLIIPTYKWKKGCLTEIIKKSNSI